MYVVSIYTCQAERLSPKYKAAGARLIYTESLIRAVAIYYEKKCIEWVENTTVAMYLHWLMK